MFLDQYYSNSIATFLLRVALIIIIALPFFFSPLRASAAAFQPTNNNAFSTFEFASNGVCISPKYFRCKDHDSLPPVQTIFTMRDVPGTGDCMFLAVALAAAASIGLGGNDVLLNAMAKETRDVVANVLESRTGNLYIDEKQPAVPARALLKQAAKTELGLDDETEYLKKLRTEGRYGGLYGGGPELAVLANVLRRPISIYELDDDDNDDDDIQKIVCRGVFGTGLFRDPCKEIAGDSAVLRAGPKGAYSWHLHILVVDVSPVEKHACALLPQ